MNDRIAPRDVMRLRDHFHDCCPEDPTHIIRDAEVLRHFRLVRLQLAS